MIATQTYDVMVEKQIAIRAYYLWERRGRPLGSPEVDWYRAVEDQALEIRTRGLAHS